MINHARTLLLNLSGSSPGFTSGPGEEFISPGFNEIKMPAQLSRVRNMLFGNNPDRLKLHYRTSQLLQLIDGTDLQQYVVYLDDRITYSFPEEAQAWLGVFGRFAVPLHSSGVIFLFGEDRPAQEGRLISRWKVQVDGSSAVVHLRSAPPITVATPYIVQSGLTEQIPLHGSSLFFRSDPSPGGSWLVAEVRKPGDSLVDCCRRLENISSEDSDYLFSGDEPFATFRKVWEEHEEMPYRLGAITLALIYRSDLLR